jgi:hypothetical protein
MPLSDLSRNEDTLILTLAHLFFMEMTLFFHLILSILALAIVSYQANARILFSEPVSSDPFASGK